MKVDSLSILLAEETPWEGNTNFRIKVIQPGLVLDKGAGTAIQTQYSKSKHEFGPLQLVMHCYLKDIHIPMHEHRNDEIMSYLYTGKMRHKDSVGQTATISASNIMMMNAGRSFYHEETSEACEALQILIRPEEQDLDSGVQFFAREVNVAKEWQLIAGPKEMSEAPLKIRNRVIIYDAYMQANSKIQIPKIEGFTPWLFIMNGELQIDNTLLTKGDAIAGDSLYNNSIHLLTDTTLVLFLSDVNA
ncbi:pirin family protein [Cytobacillus kochii]|uniref:Pirin N-terminal domain-containing protein n=1 Tax=Cytobacillus kochii TaxID=859143 RepID=A0A248TNE0_9BACI|nr:pirin family protein [Cytobacillus kochii]ASV69655.1 hypothetical protein CKF48_21500 [Cytobacillus kochii]